ncbi:MAG: hypothetical protein AB1295_03435 [Candidatus Micrarchaeota archaeon]
MSDKTETQAEDNEREAMLELAKPIRDMLSMARSRLSYMQDFQVPFVLGTLVRSLEAFPIGEMACGGIGLKITAKPIDNHSSLQLDELPGEVADIIGLQYIIKHGILGAGWNGSGPVPIPNRLRILADLCRDKSVIGNLLVKHAAEEAFLIVARKWLEDEFAKGWEIFNLSWTRAIKIAEDIPRREGQKLEFAHKVASLGEDVRLKCSHTKAPQQDGLSVDAPAFEKRPVPKQETPGGKTPKPIKR